MPIDPEQFNTTRQNAIALLLSHRNSAGHWQGHLSSSALSTATAIVALALVDRANSTTQHQSLISNGLTWLHQNQNTDGGWGDTTLSHSNIATTMLCWAALNLPAAQSHPDTPPSEKLAETWLANHAGSLDIPVLVEAVMQRYGKDRTFSIPILTMCALAGRLGNNKPGGPAWNYVKQLPFEFAAFPQSLYKKLSLRVVSYALPALIAIGQARHHHRPTLNPITRLARNLTKKSTLRVLTKIQPTNGGFLEAAPLTSFVTMSLASINLADHPVAQKGVDFLTSNVRDDGSWPIDTNLATWVTTLSVNAIDEGHKINEHLDENSRTAIRDWLLAQQYKTEHPYTGADPGGWSWTDLPGGVPDADDTSGAVIALIKLGLYDTPTLAAITNGLNWLYKTQNRDGGMPTFCRGWGKLPFDRSSNDITAHFIEAAASFEEKLGHHTVFQKAYEDAKQKHHTKLPSSSATILSYVNAQMFLESNQEPDGSSLPLWFGNQYQQNEENPIYGTAKVIKWLQHDQSALVENNQVIENNASRDWLLRAQHQDGGWGGPQNAPSSIEETALAVEALTWCNDSPETQNAIHRGANYLIEQTNQGADFPPSPIGFYFAKLWYYESLYPLIWTVAALERVAVWLDDSPQQ